MVAATDCRRAAEESASACCSGAGFFVTRERLSDQEISRLIIICPINKPYPVNESHS
jgi:hypothetical protein